MKRESKNIVLGYGAGLVSVLFWSANVIIAHLLVGKLEPAQISLGRWLVAGIILTPIVVVNIVRTWDSFRQHILRNCGLALAIGLVSISLQNTLVYAAGHTASAIDMALIGTCGPIFLALFSALLLHKPIGLKQGIGLGTACLGVILLIAHGDLSRLSQFKFVIGDLWMLLVAVSFALYTLLLSFRPKDLAPTTMLGMAVVVGVSVLSTYVWLTNPVSPAHPQGGFALPDSQSILLLVYMGIFPSVISFVCWNIALDHLGPMRTVIIYYTTPLLSSIEAYFLLGESMNISQLWGGCLILGGVVFAARQRKPQDVAVAHTPSP